MDALYRNISPTPQYNLLHWLFLLPVTLSHCTTFYDDGLCYQLPLSCCTSVMLNLCQLPLFHSTSVIPFASYPYSTVQVLYPLPVYPPPPPAHITSWAQRFTICQFSCLQPAGKQTAFPSNLYNYLTPLLKITTQFMQSHIISQSVSYWNCRQIRTDQNVMTHIYWKP